MAFNTLFDKAKASAREVASKALETTEQALNWGKETVQEATTILLTEINGLKPILTECGFVVGDINLTIPFPEVRMTIEQTQQGKKTLEQILIEDKEKCEGELRLSEIQRLILTAMVKANDLVQITGKYGYTFKRYDVSMTTTPRITLHLVSTKIN